MKKHLIKVCNLYTLDENLVLITAIHGENIYAAEPILSNDGDCLVGFVRGTEKLLTDSEIKALTY